MFNVFVHIFTRFALMAVIAAVGTAILYPLVRRWDWLVGKEPDLSGLAEIHELLAAEREQAARRAAARVLPDCDGCGAKAVAGWELRLIDEDGYWQDYNLCGPCNHDAFVNQFGAEEGGR